MSFHHQPHQKMRAIRADFVGADRTNSMHFRPLEMRLNDRNLLALDEVTRNGTNVTPGAIATVAGDMIAPRTEAGHVIQIPNGWDTPRFRFIMQLEYPSAFGGRVVQMLTGFTNKSDLTFNRTMDPNMLLYINNSVLFQETATPTPYGIQNISRMVSADQILSSAAFSLSPQDGIRSSIRTLRPEDMFSVKSLDQMVGNGTNLDSRPAFSPMSDIRKTSRWNNSGAAYLTRSVVGLASALAKADPMDSMHEITTAASEGVAENTIAQDNFLSWIRSRGLMMPGGAVPWGELVAAAPEIDHIARVHVSGGPTIQVAPGYENTEYWSAASTETVAATTLGQLCTAVMMDNMLGALSFRATNRIASPHAMGARTHTFMPLKALRLDQSDASDVLPGVTATFVGHILQEISNAGAIDYDITGHFNLLGNSTLHISFFGQPAVTYTIPTYCDSLYTPVMSDTLHSVQNLSSDVYTAADYLTAQARSTVQATQPAPAHNFGIF